MKNKEILDLTLVDNLEIEGTHDYPDFADAQIINADYNGVKMTEAQLDLLNEDSDFVHESVLNYLS